MGRIGEFEPYRVAGPYTFETEYRAESSAASKASSPGVERVDTHTVRITGDTLAGIAERK